MKMRFVLTMEDAKVNGVCIDTIIIDWVDEASQEEVLDISQQWITNDNFLRRKMVGLTSVGESVLTVEPIEECS